MGQMSGQSAWVLTREIDGSIPGGALLQKTSISSWYLKFICSPSQTTAWRELLKNSNSGGPLRTLLNGLNFIIQNCGCTFLSKTLFYFSIHLILEFIQNGFREIRISIQMFICKCISFFRNLLILNWKRCESYFSKKKCKIKKQFLEIFNLVRAKYQCKVEIKKKKNGMTKFQALYVYVVIIVTL